VLRLLAATAAAAVPGFAPFGTGPHGGTLWQGVIPNPFSSVRMRPAVVYLPPRAAPRGRYPLVVLLHGFPGSPWQFTSGLRLAQTADELIASGKAPPFVALMPPAGDIWHGAWTGPWERYLLERVLPWAAAHLPVARVRAQWTLGGLSAGGYGALDIGLRHPLLFGTIEAWSGYFVPLREDAVPVAELASHAPAVLVRGEAPLLRRLGTRFYLSAGTTGDRATARATRAFSEELRSLQLAHELLLAPGGHDGAFWRRQLAPALLYALHRQRLPQ
jgi:enterochelin esterase-like enzyme